ncbi:MAG: RidA family protein [Hyphomicrobiales bacterium]|nr:RidA family protein [Hyphomicrobiales bacterium]
MNSPAQEASSRTRARLAELGLTLHGPHPPHAPLLAVVPHGGVAYVSGQLPRIDGKITCFGRLGESVSVEDGIAAAGVSALNALAVLEAALGSLDRIERFLKVTGFVASGPNFTEQPKVIDGASHIFHDVFGEAGRHARSAIGVAALPHGAAVEIELSVAISG